MPRREATVIIEMGFAGGRHGDVQIKYGTALQPREIDVLSFAKTLIDQKIRNINKNEIRDETLF